MKSHLSSIITAAAVVVAAFYIVGTIQAHHLLDI
jgi:hypothetical protein